jgi:hypothetical protein
VRIIKKNLYLYLFIAGCLSSFVSYANSVIPDYCRFYPKFIDGKKVDQTISADEYEQNSIPQCFQKELIEFSMKELSSAVQDVEEKSLDQIGESIQHKLSYHAVKQVLEKKSEYYDLFNGVDSTPSDDLVECGKSHSHYKTDNRSLYDQVFSKQYYNPDVGRVILEEVQNKSHNVDPVKQRDFLAINLINGIKAAALLDIKKDNENQVNDAKKEYSISAKACVSMCSRMDELLRNSNCFNKQRVCYGKAIKIRDERLELYTDKEKPLYDMVSGSPLLFNNADEGELLSALGTDDLRGSPLQKKIESMIPNKELRRVKFFIKNNDQIGLREFFNEKADFLNSILDNKVKYNELKEESKKELSREYTRLDLAAEKLCQGEGEDLHHYPHLMEATFDDMYSNSLNKETLKHQMQAGQAGYCHLLNTSPLEENKISAASIGGFALLGIGGALQFVPIAGNIVGTGLMILGGTVLTGIGVGDTIDSHNRLNTDIGMHSVGYGGYKKIMKSKSARDGNLYWSAADMILIPLDLHALRALKSQKTVKSNSSGRRVEDGVAPTGKNQRKGDRRHNFAQREIIDDIEKGLGDDLVKLGNKYNPGNVHELSPGDKVYFAGVADMMEKDLIKANPKLARDPVALKKKVNKEIDEMIKDCRGEVKK